LSKSPKLITDPATPDKFGDFGDFGTGGRCLNDVQQHERTAHQTDLEEHRDVPIAMGAVPEAYAQAFATIQADRPADVPQEC
jgi:hypothetical protein